MNKLTDASLILNSFLDLLRNTAGFDIHAVIHHAELSEVEDEAGVVVELTGPDTPLLTSRNGELLHAIEHIAAKLLHLEPDEHHRISFDADHFKSKRDRALRRLAEDAVHQVRTSSTPYSFPPMSSRERLLLHLALAPSGLRSASVGDAIRRSVVLYPEAAEPSLT